MGYSITETYNLPSKGKVYNKEIDPNIILRSMTTMEEKKRLGSSSLPYKVIAEIINDCIIDNKSNISAYDLTLGDFQYLLFKLRTVTYGSKYKVSTRCPFCLATHETELDLDDLKIFEYDDTLREQLNIILPVSQKEITLKLLTPRDMDRIDSRAKEILSKSKDYQGSPTYLLMLEAIIDNVDNEKISSVQKERLVQTLVLKDANFLQKSHNKIKLGVDTLCNTTCPFCKKEYPFSLPFSGEFLGPSID